MSPSSKQTKQHGTDGEDWDKLVLSSGRPHYMQSSVWGAFKARNHWPTSQLIVTTKIGILPVQVFSRTVPGIGRLHYAPEVVGVTKDTLPALTKQIRKQYQSGVAFKLELYQPHSEQLIDVFANNDWVKANSIQPRDTVMIDLTGGEDDMLMRLKKRARYEVRVAQKGNVRVEKVAASLERLETLAKLIDATGQRTGAFFRHRTYLNQYWQAFAKNGQGDLYFAWHGKDLLAGAFVITYGKAAWYKDGGSVRQKSNLMAPRFLLWEIMRDLQTRGIEQFDLSGIPSPEEAETSHMKGLFAFKTGFTRDTARFMPAMELPLGHRYKLWPKTELRFLQLYSGIKKDFWY